MNTSIVNNSCHDLNQVILQENGGLSFIMFCKSYLYDDRGAIQSTLQYVVGVLINESDVGNEVTFRYMQITNSVIDFESPSGYQFVGYQNQSLAENNNTIVLFIASSLSSQRFYYTQQILAAFNFSVFLDMKRDEIIVKKGSIDVKSQIDYDERYADKKAIAFELVNIENIMIAVVFENMGISLCQLTQLALQPQPYVVFIPTLKCNRANSSMFIYQANAIDVYWNFYDPNYFYIATSSPPGVVEVNIENPWNAYVVNQYMVPYEQPEYIGLETISTSSNIIVHQIYNILTRQRILRVYNRIATKINVAKYQFIVPLDSKSNFFVFPSFYQNILLFRDERRINVTTFNDYKIILNGSNYELVQKYKYQKFNITITGKNNYQIIPQSFIASFVDESFLDVVASGRGETEHDIFYNCGDIRFRYSLTDLFSGPNFNLSIQNQNNDNCTDGSCYFQIQNQGVIESQNYSYNFSGCQISFVFSEGDQEDNQEINILICVDTKESRVVSYKMLPNRTEPVKTNEIELPQMLIQYVAFDNDDRFFFIISQIQNEDQDYFEFDNEVHFFSIQNEVVWEDFNSGPIKLTSTQSLADFEVLSYNQEYNKGIMVSYKENQTDQLFIYFNVAYENYYQFQVQAMKTDYVTFQNSTFLAVVSNEGFVFSLQVNKQLNIQQIILINEEYKFVNIKQTMINNEDEVAPHDMKIYDDFLILFYESNEIVIYLIQNKINLQYKMKLPLYKEYSDFRFGRYKWPTNKKKITIGNFISIKQSYLDGLLSILLVNEDYNGNYVQYIFTYSLFQSQHDSLVMVFDATPYFDQTKYQDISLLGSNLQASLALVSDSMITISKIQFFSQLELSNDHNSKAELFKLCQNSKADSYQQGNGTQIKVGSLIIKGISNINQSACISDKNQIQLNIYSQNQGISITPVNQNSQQSYTNVINKHSNYSSYPLVLSLQDIVEGYNVSYQIACSYFDSNGITIDCTRTGIQDGTQPRVYNFYIEFVTKQRQVVKSFSLMNSYIMFDTNHIVTILNLPQNNLDAINGFSLQQSRPEVLEEVALGCEIDGYIGVQEEIRNNDPKNPTALYILMYQCSIDQVYYIRIAWLKLQSFEQRYAAPKKAFEFKNITESIRMPYKVIDIEKYTISAKNQDTTKVNTTISMTLEVPGSYSNLLIIYGIYINTETNEAQFKKITEINSYKLGNKNTFKVSQIYSIPASSLAFVVDTLFGVYILDLRSYVILREIDLWSDNQFFDQNIKQIGALQVYKVVGNMPYCIHVLSNYGIYIYNFGVNLEDRDNLYPNFYDNLQPEYKRVIRYSFELLNSELAQNRYGYAFLLKEVTGKETFDIYLCVVSFFSSPTNQIFREIKVSSGTQLCHSLNIESSLKTDDQEDQIMVSFICNTQFYIAQTSFKPYFSINMTSYTNSTIQKKQRLVSGAEQFNQYNISIKARNEFFIDELNEGAVNITVNQKVIPKEQFPIPYLLIIILITIGVVLLLIIDFGCRTTKENEDQKVSIKSKKRYKYSLAGETRTRYSSVYENDNKDETKLLNLQAMNKITKELGSEEFKFKINLTSPKHQDSLKSKKEKFTIETVKLNRKDRFSQEQNLETDSLDDNIQYHSIKQKRTEFKRYKKI